MKTAYRKTDTQIAREWDNIAVLRHKQVMTGIDISYRGVIVPNIIKLISRCNLDKVVDIGCGSGWLTNKIGKKAIRTIGIDISKSNIELAKKCYGNDDNLSFYNASIIDFLNQPEQEDYTLALLNMVLMTTSQLDEILRSTFRILKPKAHLVLSISHPCFWPSYWNYSHEDWYKYWSEIPIEAKFRISLDHSHNFVTTHFHRPLEKYITSLISSGFVIDAFMEPQPNKRISRKYPAPWQYPHFALMRCFKPERP